jgi:anti-anti-sigma factor
VEYTVQNTEEGNNFILKGQMTFKDHAATAALKGELVELVGAGKCILDMQGLDFVDSSGLGSLIAIREAIEHKGIEIVLRHPQPKVLKIIQICGFDSLFTIEE